MRHEKSIKSLCQLNAYLIIIILHKKYIDKIMSDLFVFRCQKCSTGKLIFYAGGEYKISTANFSTGIPFKIHFLIKRKYFS